MNTQSIGVESLFVSSFNTRKDLGAGQEDSGIRELAAAIEKQGLLQPLTVRPAEGGFEVISGQRRLKACRHIGMREIPCIVRDDLSDSDAVTVSLVENIHRADMAPMDKARALKALYDDLGTQQKVAEETGWSATTVSKYLKLLELPADLQKRLNTADGAAGVSSLSRLASTFSGEDAIMVYDRIGGFTQKIQQEILRRSEGVTDRIDRLVSEAQEGVFDVRRCGNERCSVVQQIAQGEMELPDFEILIEGAIRNVGRSALEEQLRKSARNFWKSLVP